MQRAVVLTNETCNQNCAFCSVRRPAEVPAFVAAGAVRRRIDAAAAAGVREVVLAGGEPTLRRDLAAIVAHARAAGVATVTLETNGALVTEASASALRAAGLSGARVKLTAWGEAGDAITRDPGGSAATLRGLRALGRAGVPITITTSIVRANLALVAALPDALAESGLPIAALVLAVPLRAPDAATLASVEEATAAVTAVAEAGRRVGLTVQLDTATYLPPCLFRRPDRIAHLYALSRGGAAREGYEHAPACEGCAARDRCPGLPAALLARGEALTVRPIVEDRVRRRLTVISSVEEQIRRELVTHEMLRQPDGSVVPGATVRVNFHCNQACHFCFVSTHLPPPDDADVREAITAIARRGGVLALSGGEPTLNPRLAEYVRLGKREGARSIELQTNAIRLADAALAREVAEAGVSDALVSLHGSTAAISDSVTAAPGTFDKTVRGVDALVASGVRVRLNFVFCAANRDDFPDFVALVARRWPAAAITFSFVGSHTDVVPRTAALIPRYADIVPALVAGLDAGRDAGLTITGFESMCGLPLCLVPDGARAYFDLPEIAAGADGGEFLKTEACAGCALTSRCWGLRRGYAELHGTSELRAVAAPSAVG